MAHTEVPDEKSLIPEDKQKEKNNELFRKGVVDKLVRPDPADQQPEYKPNPKFSEFHLNRIARDIAAEIRDNRTIMELLPDTKAIFTLMVSTIKSPNTLIGSDLLYRDIEVPSGVEWEGDPNSIIRDWLTETYNIDSKLTEILWDVLCWKGSYPILTLPETAIDDLINGRDKLVGESFESVLKDITPFNLSGNITDVSNIGIVNHTDLKWTDTYKEKSVSKHKPEATFAKIIGDSTIVTDNLECFKRPALVAERIEMNMAAKRKKDRRGKGKLLAHKVKKDGMLDPADVFRTRKYKESKMIHLNATVPSDRSLGNGLIIDLPPESVIPLGLVYIVLTDGAGRPITLDNYATEYESMKSGINLDGDTSLGGGLISTVRDAYEGSKDKGAVYQKQITINTLMEEYGQVFDGMIKDLLTGTEIIGDRDSLVLPNMDDVHLLGVIRALRGLKTTMIVVPRDQITYFHYEKNDYGVGISLLSRYKFLASQRISIRLANLLAAVTNSVPRREVLMNIDPDDKEPYQTFEMMKSACMDTLESEFSIGTIDSRDIITNFVRANTTVRGIHPDLPDHHMEVKDYVRSVPEVDSDLEERLRGDMAKALDTQPELIDEYYKPNFAIEQVTKSLMQTKSIIEKQKYFEPQLNEHVKQLCYSIPQLYRLLKDGIKITKTGRHSEEDILAYIIESFYITFPRPEQYEMEANFDALENVEKYIDKVLETIINEDMLYRVIDGDSLTDDSIKVIQSQLKALCLREWITYGTTTIIKRLLESGEDNEPAVDIATLLAEHNGAIINNLGDFLQDVLKRTTKIDAKITDEIEDLKRKIDEERAEKEKAIEEAKRLKEEAENPQPEGDNDDLEGGDSGDDKAEPEPDTDNVDGEEDTPNEDEPSTDDDETTDSTTDTEGDDSTEDDEGNPWDAGLVE